MHARRRANTTDLHRAVALPAANERVLIALTDGAGLLDIEHAPPLDEPGSEGQQLGPVATLVDELAQVYGVGVRLRVERGMGHATGIDDAAALGVAAIGALATALTAAGHGKRLQIDDQALAKRLGVQPATVSVARQGGVFGVDGAAATWVLADAKAAEADWQAALNAAGAHGGVEVVRLGSGPMLVAVCADSGEARRCKEAVIETFAMRGIWPRGRSGPVAARGVHVTDLTAAEFS